MSTSETNETRHTREDLVQVELELYSHMLREARQKQDGEPGSVAARFLEADEASLAIFAAHIDPMDSDAVAIEIGRQAALAAPELLTGLRADEPVTWKAIDLGAESRRRASARTVGS